MRQAVPRLEVLLSCVQGDRQIVIVKFGAKYVLNPCEDGVGRGRLVSRVVHQGPFEATNSSGFGTGSIYMVMPPRPRVTACSIKGFASAANILKLDSFAST